MALINELMSISELDLRHNFTDFYFSFNLDSFYSKPSINAIMTGKTKNPKFSKFLTKCLKIYKSHTKDYNEKAKTIEKVFNNYNLTHMIPVTYERLANALDSDATTIARVIRSKVSSKTANNILDVLEMNLFNTRSSAKMIFNNMSAYVEITRKIMRDEIGNGIDTRSLEEVSKDTGIKFEYLRHPEKLCKDAMLYLDCYQKLIDNQQDYKL